MLQNTFFMENIWNLIENKKIKDLVITQTLPLYFNSLNLEFEVLKCNSAFIEFNFNLNRYLRRQVG